MKSNPKIEANLSIKKDTITFGVALIVERAASFFVLPILTKNLSPELFGIWSQIIIAVSLLTSIVLLHFHTALVNYFSGSEHDVGKKEDVFHTIFGILLINSFVFFIIIFIFSNRVGNIIFGSSVYSNFVLLLWFLLITEALIELMTSYLRASQRIRLLSIYYIIKNFGRIIILAVSIVFLELSLSTALIVLISWQLIFGMFIYLKDIIRNTSLSLSFNFKENIKEIMSFSLPLVPLSILLWLNNFVDRYFVLHILNLRQVSLYSVAYSIAAITGIFYAVLGFTLYPQLAKLWSRQDKISAADLFSRALNYYLFFLIPSIALLTILSSSLISLISTSAYISNWTVVLWLGVGIGLFGIYQIYFYLTLLGEKSFLNLIVAGMAVLLNLILNVILIPLIGISGAAIATTLSNSILAFCTIIISKRVLPVVFPWKGIAKIINATVVMSSFLFLVQHYFRIQNTGTLVLIIIIAGVIYLLVDLLDRNSIIRQLVRSI